jgi:hypothetical protein
MTLAPAFRCPTSGAHFTQDQDQDQDEDDQRAEVESKSPHGMNAEWLKVE